MPMQMHETNIVGRGEKQYVYSYKTTKFMLCIPEEFTEVFQQIMTRIIHVHPVNIDIW